MYLIIIYANSNFIHTFTMPINMYILCQKTVNVKKVTHCSYHTFAHCLPMKTYPHYQTFFYYFMSTLSCVLSHFLIQMYVSCYVFFPIMYLQEFFICLAISNSYYTTHGLTYTKETTICKCVCKDPHIDPG